MRTLRLPPLRTSFFVVSAALCVVVFVVYTSTGGDPVDALCYWAMNPAAPYVPNAEPQFVYSPAAAQIIAPFLNLPFATFVAGIRAAELVSLLVVAGPVAGPLLFLPQFASEINAANINMVLALVMVLGFRWPALWAIPLLTKPSMGVGLLWFAVRREWRKLAIAVGTAGAIATASFLFAPALWFDWISLLSGGTPAVGSWPFPYPIWARLPFAIALVVWGARTNRRWTVVGAAVLALPRLYFFSPAMLVGVLPLVRRLGFRLVPAVRRFARLDEEPMRGNELEPVGVALPVAAGQ